MICILGSLGRITVRLFRAVRLEGADAGGLRSKALVWSRLIAGIVGLNLAEGLGVRLFSLLCVV
jgi:hypothetical protein